MAKIMGIEIKNVKNSRGHEGEPCPYGTIYLDGKKLGIYATDTWGGSGRFESFGAAEEKQVEDRIAAYFEKYPCFEGGMYLNSVDVFMDILMELDASEKAFIRRVKTDSKKRGKELPWKFVQIKLPPQRENGFSQTEGYCCPSSQNAEKLIRDKNHSLFCASASGNLLKSDKKSRLLANFVS